MLAGMELTDADIQDFIECWKADGGGILTPEQARAEALRLLTFFATLEGVLQNAERDRGADQSDTQHHEILPILP
jgi:hypothetical protein